MFQKKTKIFFTFNLILSVLLFLPSPVFSQQPPLETLNVFGWSWGANTSQGGIGWISLNGRNIPAITQGYGLRVKLTGSRNYTENPDLGIFEGYAWADNIGWINFSPSRAELDQLIGSNFPTDTRNKQTGYHSVFVDFDAQDNNLISGATLGQSEKFLRGYARVISFENYSFDPNQNKYLGWIHFGNNVAGSLNAKIDLGNGSIKGYAWSGGHNYTEQGLGWIQFKSDANVKTLDATAFSSWLKADEGDIHSNKDIGDIYSYKPDPGAFNAAFLITAKGRITRYTSASPQGEMQVSAAPEFEIDLDYSALASQAQNNHNYYSGSFFAEYKFKNNCSVLGLGIPFFLSNCVEKKSTNQDAGEVIYIKKGDLVIDQNLKFNKGRLTIVLEEGNLIINNNLEYDNTVAFTKKTELPSVAFILRQGGVVVDPDVTNIVGTFYVNGDLNKTTLVNIKFKNNIPLPQGTFLTISKYPGQADKQLVTQGVVVAREFNLQRNYFEPASSPPSERFIYDGRIYLNTPPGLSQFEAIVPEWSEEIPQ
jgi:hypothetical protein